MAMRLCSLSSSSSSSSSALPRIRSRPKKLGLCSLKCSADNRIAPSLDASKLVSEVKEKLAIEYPTLPIGRNGRDDEDMILWFLKDRKFSKEEATTKLIKAIKWRQEFGVLGLTEESVKNMYATGKAYVHESLDINNRPVLIVVASKHFGSKEDTSENERLCVYLVEKAVNKLPEGVEDVLGILDLRGFRIENGDVSFLKFLVDVFYYYYPKRLGQLLFVEAPFIFQPIWRMIKPLMKSYSSLVRFCDVETVQKEYFTEETLPSTFKL